MTIIGAVPISHCLNCLRSLVGVRSLPHPFQIHAPKQISIDSSSSNRLRGKYGYVGGHIVDVFDHISGVIIKTFNIKMIHSVSS